MQTEAGQCAAVIQMNTQQLFRCGHTCESVRWFLLFPVAFILSPSCFVLSDVIHHLRLSNLEEQQVDIIPNYKSCKHKTETVFRPAEHVLTAVCVCVCVFQVLTWRRSSTRTSVSQFGTSVVRTRSDLCGDTTSRIHRYRPETRSHRTRTQKTMSDEQGRS